MSVGANQIPTRRLLLLIRMRLVRIAVAEASSL